MKRTKRLYFSLIALLCLAGCSTSSDAQFKQWMEKEGTLRVLSTTAMIDDLVQKIGGEYVASLVLVQGELDPHSYELVKGDDEKLKEAHIVFYNGLGLEHGASLAYHLEQDSKNISVGDYVWGKCPEKMIFIDHIVDPHIWMDISLWKEATYPIEEELVRQDPVHAEYYQQRAEALREEMETYHRKVKELLAQVPPSKRYLVASHDAFNYFCKTYLATEEERMKGDWKKRFASPEGLTPEGQLSPLDVRRILDHLKEHQIHVIFTESNVSKDSIRKIESCAQSTGIPVTIASDALYADTMGPNSEGRVPDYVQMIEYNAKTLVNYLQETL